MLNPTLVSREDEDICLLFRPSNHKWSYLCDCGVASDLSIRDCRDLGALFISHTHIDHFNHFDELMRHQLAVGRAIVLVGPTGLARQVSARLNSYTWNLSFDEQAVSYEVREVISPNQYAVYRLQVPLWEAVHIEDVESDVVFECEAFSAKTAILDHGTDSIAYRFDEPPSTKIGTFEQRPGPWVGALKQAFAANDGERLIDVHGEEVRAETLFDLLYVAPGDSLGFIMDHAASEENHDKIASLMSDVKTLYIECYYHDEDEALAKANAHSTTAGSGSIAGRVRANVAVPCHFSRRYMDRLDVIRDAFDAAYKEALEASKKA